MRTDKDEIARLKNELRSLQADNVNGTKKYSSFEIQIDKLKKIIKGLEDDIYRISGLIKERDDLIGSMIRNHQDEKEKLKNQIENISSELDALKKIEKESGCIFSLKAENKRLEEELRISLNQKERSRNFSNDYK